MKKKYNNYIVAFLLGVTLTTTIGVTAATVLNGSQIQYTGNRISNVNTIQQAIDELYNVANECDMPIGGSGGDLTGVFWKFPAFAGEQTFEVPVSGNYKLEVWGAQGGNYNDTYFGGYGAYSVGTINIDKTQTPILYINVGGAGLKSSGDGVVAGGYNGGANAYVMTSSCGQVGGSGGGATHIATRTGTLDQLEQYKGEYDAERGTSNSSVILIVAGGGGGAIYRTCGSYLTNMAGGSAGGYISSIESNKALSYSMVSGTSATQNSAGTGGSVNNEAGAVSGSFGKANQSNRSGGITCTPGGGGGFYGGGTGTFAGGTGGSGYIGSSLLTNKHMTCWDCTESNDEHIKTQRVSNSNNKSETPTADYVKIGNGFAKITYLGNSN